MLKEYVRRTKEPSPIIYDSGTNDVNQSSENIALAKETPLVVYRDIIIRDLETLNINSTGFLPYCTFTFRDDYSLINRYSFPTDDEIFKVRIDPGNESTASINIDFKVLSCKVINDEDKIVQMEGSIDINGFYIQGNDAFKNMTSWQVYEKIAKTYGLGFYSNFSSSQDKMTWLNPSSFGWVFLQEILEHAWISTNSLPWAFCDWYYNLTYVDLQKAFEQPRDKSKVRHQSLMLSPEIFKKSPVEGDGGIFYITNHPNRKKTNTYISNYSVYNNTTETGINYGYSRLYGWYDLEGDYKNKRKGNIIWKSLIDLSTTNGNKVVQLKRDGGDYSSFYKNQKTTNFAGKLNKANVHTNYFLAEGHNDWNIKNSRRISMVVTMEKAFLFPYRFEKILVYLVDPNKPENGPIPELSGDWVVSGITYNWDRLEGGSTDLILIKKSFGIEDAKKDIEDIFKMTVVK